MFLLFDPRSLIIKEAPLKLFKLENGKYFEVKDLGELISFSEISLMAQIVGIRDADSLEGAVPLFFAKGPQVGFCIFFSKKEEEMIGDLSNLAVGGLRSDRGLGHSSSGSSLFLEALCEKTRWYPTYLPQDPTVPFAEVTEWILALSLK